jgi:hypothetical protein
MSLEWVTIREGERLRHMVSITSLVVCFVQDGNKLHEMCKSILRSTHEIHDRLE